jgi:hypothetical protein
MASIIDPESAALDRNGTEIFEDFVGIYKGYFDPNWCQEVVEYFNFCEQNTTFAQKRKEDYVEDTAMFMTNFDKVRDVEITRLNKNLSDYFYKGMEICINKYIQQYRILEGLQGYAVYDLKLQKTLPLQGFHAWHYENVTKVTCMRKLVVMLYLNDVEEGGETEFLYYPKRIKPEAGKFLIWPAEFTHTHRGNAPLAGEKYIITSWVEVTG